MWTKSACVVLAWSILLIILVAVGMKGSVRPAQASIRTASSTEVTTLASTLSVAAAFVPAARPAARYVVQPGDTLSGIAARFAVRGGWPALYAANRPLIGSDPDVLRPGTVLVLPGQRAPVRYTVVSGDTLSGIAAALAVRGGWPALYAANRRVIGPDPNVIRPGTVLTVSQPAAPSPAPSPPVTAPGRPRYPVPPSSAPAGSGHRPAPEKGSAGLRGNAAMAEDHAAGRRPAHRGGLPRRAGAGAPPSAPAGRRPGRPAAVPAGQGPGSGRLVPEKARVVLADYDRVVVTRSTRDDTVYVLRPPGEDPRAILRAARLVLPEDLYRELAGQLGLPASWPIVLADYDRVVVTHCTG